MAALASYLDARAHDGAWLLRIEDIDPPRVEPGSDITIRQQLRFLGMHWDAPPLYQSARVDRYQAVFAALQAQGLIYGCGCTRREIIQAAREAREHAPQGDETPYLGTCRQGLPAGRTARAWRFRIDRHDTSDVHGDQLHLRAEGTQRLHTRSENGSRNRPGNEPQNVLRNGAQNGLKNRPRPENQPPDHLTGGMPPNPLPDATNLCDFPAILRTTAANVEAGNTSVSGMHKSQPERQVCDESRLHDSGNTGDGGAGDRDAGNRNAGDRNAGGRNAEDGDAGDTVSFHDRWLGPQRQIPRLQCGDFILRRADGVWAYQLGVVVDDAESGVTDVVRGADLLSSTGRQILLLRALGAPIPRYMHLPLVMGDSGQKLSKQNGAPGVDTSGRIDAVDILEEAARALGLYPIGTRDVQRWLHGATQQWRDRFVR